MKKTLTLIVALLLANLLFASLLPAWGMSSSSETTIEKSDSLAPGDADPDEIILKFKSQVSEKTAEAVVKSEKDKITSEIDDLSLKKVKVEKSEGITEAIKDYEEDPNIEFAEPDYKQEIMVTPNDSQYDSQWSHPVISSPQGWDITTGSSSTTIAIVDTGVDYNHSDLSGKVTLGYDYYNNDSDPMDGHGHGTHCAGIAAAQTNNGTGVAGVSWGSRILAVKVLGDSGYGTSWSVAQGITYAADNGADVISLSLGSSSYSQTMKDAVDDAYSKGSVIVAAAGNSGRSGVIYPAAYPHVIAVASTTSSDARSSFSTYGPEVDVAAPGSSVLSTLPGNTYQSWSGTSMATPHVAGLAGLLKSQAPSASNDEIEQQIESSADDLGSTGKDDYYGYGRINVYRALNGSVISRPNGSVVKTPFDSKVYYIENGYKRWVVSATAFITNGFGWNDIATASIFEMINYAEGDPVRCRPGTLLKSSSNSTIYMVNLSGTTYQKRWITSGSIYTGLGLSWGSVRTVADSELAEYTSGSNLDETSTHPDGTLIKAASSPDVYLLENSSKRWITSSMAFTTHNFRWGDVVTISDSEMVDYEPGPAIRYQEGTLIKSNSSSKVYFVDYSSGQYYKRWIASGSAFTCLGLSWSNVLTVSDGELAAYTDGSPIQ